MIDDENGRALRILKIITGLLAVLFGGFILVGLAEEPPAGIMGIAGLIMGGLITTCFNLSGRQSVPAARRPAAADETIAEFAERLREIEIEQGRVGELEERLDFAERLLAERQAVKRLP